jgi:hypothetical protein
MAFLFVSKNDKTKNHKKKIIMDDIATVTKNDLIRVVLRFGSFVMFYSGKKELILGIIPKKLFKKYKKFILNHKIVTSYSELDVAKFMLTKIKPNLIPSLFKCLLDYIYERERSIWVRQRILSVNGIIANLGKTRLGKTINESNIERYLAINQLIPHVSKIEDVHLNCLRMMPENVYEIILFLNTFRLPREMIFLIITFL